LHGYGIGTRITQISRGVFNVNAGSLFPAFRPLERDGLVKGVWRATEITAGPSTNALTPHGRATLKRQTPGVGVAGDGDQPDPESHPGEL